MFEGFSRQQDDLRSPKLLALLMKLKDQSDITASTCGNSGVSLVVRRIAFAGLPQATLSVVTVTIRRPIGSVAHGVTTAVNAAMETMATATRIRRGRARLPSATCFMNLWIALYHQIVIDIHKLSLS